MNPGDTSVTPVPWVEVWLAQRRPGREPRRHPQGPLLALHRRALPLNEGRGVNPGDTASRRQARASCGSLNEGRGVNPGDTSGSRSPSSPATRSAQRRPGREPRRHAAPARRRTPQPSSLNEGRGVNPGDTRRVAAAGPACRPCAQRRPGREPRRHVSVRDSPDVASTAQRRPGREPRRHGAGLAGDFRQVGRSTKAGA